MLWRGVRRPHYRRRNDRSKCLVDVIVARYRDAMPLNLLTDEELKLLTEWHERRANECRAINDLDAAMDHDDRVVELAVIRDFCGELLAHH